MTKRMLIDATHAEETRVVVLQDQQLVDFDFESSTKKQLKGNVYLAKVTRVEPSLQAAFVEYGGNRHGFLAFSEIHPDYFQIPQADRELLAKLERESVEADAANGDARRGRGRKRRAEAAEDESDAAEGDAAEGDAAYGEARDGEADDDERPIRVREDSEEETADVMSEQARRRARLLRSYKIQEVIKRRQIMLVQVVKEERGNKGAALTTYLSLAGRYCVLMPNTARGGGISRKISSSEDRSKLKAIVAELDVPQGMGLIVRTAGQQRSRAEIKRDYDYLMRLWSDIRDTTLQSVAPALIYEEGDLIKRAMRDLYSRDIDEVLVEGEEAHKSAKRLMTMMMPSRARHVKLYKEELPLFFKYKVEDQLDAMHSPIVQLPSGGSIVMHATEALIAIDVNSGKSTRERHIDETAVKTNLEAADEIARQLRLRDLAGLVVIDFIDMGEMRHQRAVERRVRDALKIDRARIQLGKISMFGLLELSRQRLRPSLQELSSRPCPTCQGWAPCARPNPARCRRSGSPRKPASATRPRCCG
ncbi:MAG: ribonuclease E/G [Geminicoccaceae bacterium]